MIGQMGTNGGDVSFGGLLGLRGDGDEAVLASLPRPDMEQFFVQA